MNELAVFEKTPFVDFWDTILEYSNQDIRYGFAKELYYSWRTFLDNQIPIIKQDPIQLKCFLEE